MKTRKLSLIFKLPNNVLFNQLRNHINSERLRLLKRELLLPSQLPEEEPSLLNGHSNLTSREMLKKLLAMLPIRRLPKTEQDF